jgi:transposase
MDDVNDDAKGVFRRVELLTGPGRRRRWSASEKSLIVEQTLEPGVTVTEVARRWQVCPQQVWGWRRESRVGGPMSSSDATSPNELNFVPVMAATPLMPANTGAHEAKSGRTSAEALPSIEVQLAGAVVRVGNGTNLELLTEVLRAVRASAA